MPADQNRFSYFLDYLAGHSQAHKLLFWFEIEQFKLLAGDDRVRTQTDKLCFQVYGTFFFLLYIIYTILYYRF